MSTHSLDNQLEERLFKKIADLEQQVREVRTLQLQGTTAVGLAFTDFQLKAITVADGAVGAVSFTLTNSGSNPLFAIPFLSVYETTATAGNEIGVGLARDANYRVVINPFNYESVSSSSLTAKVSVTNNTGSSKTIGAICKWLYIINGGTPT